ncbi:hypothetical protein ACFLQI_01650 [Candidatus Undinarchaeota archaeon]
MKKNEKDAFVALLGAIGLILILIPIFTNLYPFTQGLLAALAFWIASGILKTHLELQSKEETNIAILGAVGFIILLGGIFTSYYEFNYGLLAALIIWVLTGVLRKYYGLDKPEKKK